MGQSALVGCSQHHTWRSARIQRLLPTRRTQAPTVARPQPGKAEFRHWGRKIVSTRFGEFEERRGHDGADGVATRVLLPGVAAAVAVKASDRLDRTDFQRFAKHIAWRNRPALSVTAIVSEHAAPSAELSRVSLRVVQAAFGARRQELPPTAKKLMANSCPREDTQRGKLHHRGAHTRLRAARSLSIARNPAMPI